MTSVKITGWREGLNKIQLNHLLQQHGGHGLGEAKHAVDALLAGETVTFESADPASATAFCRSASAIGAECHISAEARDFHCEPERTARKTGS